MILHDPLLPPLAPGDVGRIYAAEEVYQKAVQGADLAGAGIEVYERGVKRG